MSWENELAREFTKRDNKSPLGAVVGTVITVNPLRISILGGNIILNSDKLYMCSNVANVILNDKDQVLCLPADGGRTFFIVDKVV